MDNNENLEFMNSCSMIEKVASCIPILEEHEALYETISDPVKFFTLYGQCLSSMTYARFGKISKELAQRTLKQFLTQFEQDIKSILYEVEEINGG